jgi:uncharacterized protein (DUF433 family)
MKYPLIEIDPRVCNGAPKIKGRRLTVYDVVSGIFNEGLDVYLSDREISIAEASQAILYSRNLQCQIDAPQNFCSGCILRTIKDGWKFSREELQEITLENQTKITLTEGGGIYLDAIEKYEHEKFGNLGWAMAETVLQRYPKLAVRIS